MNSQTMIKKQFRGFLPVVIDIETSGSDCHEHGILEIAAIAPKWDGKWLSGDTYHAHVELFEGAETSDASMAIHGIIPDHPFREAVTEQKMLEDLTVFIIKQCSEFDAKRGILVGHNPSFDFGFLQEAERRSGIELPLHKYTLFDTATLGMLVYRETVLAKLCRKAGLPFDTNQAHGALYDTEMTAQVFWSMVNHSRK